MAQALIYWITKSFFRFFHMQDLETACIDGNENDVREILQRSKGENFPRSGAISCPEKASPPSLFFPTSCPDGETYLMKAALNNHPQVMTLLLEAQADVEERDAVGESCLLKAASRGLTQVVRTLLDAHAHVDSSQLSLPRRLRHSTSTPTQTPLVAATRGQYAEVVGLLLAYKADIFHENEWGENCLLEAVSNGQWDARSSILGTLMCIEEVNVDRQNSYGTTALVEAVFTSDVRIVKSLLDLGANPNRCNSQRKNSLQIACERGEHKMVELLLEYDMDVNRQNEMTGDTSLHLAVQSMKYRAPDIVALLLEARADMDMENYIGCTPVEEAKTRNCDRIMDLFLGHREKMMG